MQAPVQITTAEQARNVIESTFAVIKMISSPISPSVDNRSWQLIIEGLNEPHKHRYVKPIDNNVNRGLRFNPQEKQWERRTPHPVRGRDKATPFTKKTSLTLIPPGANIVLFAPRYGTPIGLLFDWRLCHRKGDRYVFAKNIVSDQKPWLAREGKHQQPPEGISFDLLQWMLNQISPNKSAVQNELLGGLHRNAVLAMVAPENTLFIRLNALAKQVLMLKCANLDLPILIFDKLGGILEYTIEMRKRDIAEILRNPYPITIKSLAESCRNPYDFIMQRYLNVTPKGALIELAEFPRHAIASPIITSALQKDVRRRTLFYLDFFSLVLLRQQISDIAEPGLLRLKADITFVIKNFGLFDLCRVLEIQPENLAQSYQQSLTRCFPLIKHKWQSAFESSEIPSSAFMLLPHLILLNSDLLAGSLHPYALVGKVEQGAWGESELRYRDVGLHIRRNLLFSALDNVAPKVLQQLAILNPSWIPSTCAALQTLYRFALKNARNAKYKITFDPLVIASKWRGLLAIAPHNLLVDIAADPLIKPHTLAFILGIIYATSKLADIHACYDRYAHSPLINIRRNPKWDSLCSLLHPKRKFGCLAYPASQQKVIISLQERACEILTHSHHSNADAQTLLNSPLFDREHLHRGIPETYYIFLDQLRLGEPTVVPLAILSSEFW